MLKKKADFAFTNIRPVNSFDFSQNENLFRTAAANRITIEPGSEKSKIIESEVKKHPNALFFRAKAIEADAPNSNGDYFSEDELLKSYKSFEGVPFFTNHNNQNIENARGKIIFAEWIPEEKAVYTLAFVDRDAYPDICRGIEQEYVTGVSMGALYGDAVITMADLSEKKISEIKSGDVVRTAYGNNKQVKMVHNEFLGKKMYQFDLTTYHKSPLFTNDHPIFSIEKSVVEAEKLQAIRSASDSKYQKRMGYIDESVGQNLWREKDYIPEFKHADMVQDGDYFLVPSKFDIQDGSSENSDFYYVVGAYLGDGYLKKDKNGNFEALSFCFGKDEIEMADKVVSILKKYTKSDPCKFVCEERNGLYINYYDRKLAQWFYDNFGTGSKSKKIKVNIPKKDDALNLLAGYLDTDGCISNKTNLNHTSSVQFSSANIGLLEDIQSILISLGAVSRISTFDRKPSLNSVVRVNTTEHTLSVESTCSKLFKSSIKHNINECQESKINAGKTFITEYNGKNYMACPVKSISVIDFDEPVYDITVEDDECYIADGLAVHNCSVEYSVCNICSNKAERTDDYCSHIKNRKGRKFTGTARDVKTGETKSFKDHHVFEYNFGLKFIELSAVVDPACPSCHIEGIIPNCDYLSKVASMENSLRMIRSAALEKKASQEEIQQMDGVLQTLETFAVNLVKKRKQVEMTFASELVDILSKLQTWLDELVGAGYGNLPDTEVPGTVGNAEAPAPAPAPEPPPPASLASPPAVTGAASVSPIAAETSTGKSPVQSPKLPITTPIRPRASTEDGKTIQRIADFSCKIPSIVDIENRHITGDEIIRKASTLCEKLNKEGDISMAKRRTINAKQQEKEKVIEVLSNSWKEKQDFFEYIKQMPSIQDNDSRLLINKRDDSFIIMAENKSNSDDKTIWTYEDLTDEDKKLIQASPQDASVKFLEVFSEKSKQQKEGENMTDIKKNAGALTVNKVPDEVQEAQLRQKGLYHSRTEEEKNVVTQAQLESLRKGEPDVLTERQLDSSRTNTEADEVQEAQLKPLREDNEKNTVTQDQLKDKRNDSEPDVVTEKQLNSTPAPWARSANRDPAKFKSASDHMKAVINVLANSVLSSGCTPEESCEVAASLVDSTKNRVYLASSIIEQTANDESVNHAKRIAFWNNKNLKVASTGKKEIAESVVNGLRKVASDSTINPDVLINALDVISENDKGVASVNKAVEAKIAEASIETTQVSVKSELRDALENEVNSKSDRDEERNAILEAATSADAKIQRESERQVWDNIINKEAAKTASHVIETSFTEAGLKQADKKGSGFKKDIVSFAKGALASQNLRLAAVTNVTISGDTIQIAVQTDEGDQEIEIPIGDDSAPALDETVPEGDMSGEGLEGTLSTPPAAPATPPAGGMAPMTPMASNRKKMTKVAQSPMGGGMAGAGGGVSAPGASEQALPGATPDGEAIQSLTQGMPEDEAAVGDVPTIGEQQMPWTTCPECGSSDTDVSNAESGDITGKCNGCGAEYEALLKKTVEFKITKPTVSVGKPADGGGEIPEAPAGAEAPAAPEIPALPVAAQTKLDKGAIVRIATNKKNHGHVCPACGHKNCKASKDRGGRTEYFCSACNTDVVKDILISTSNPSNSVLRVSWDVRPPTGCKGCGEKVAIFASKVKMSQMLKTAANDKGSFPMNNCIERMARQYGGNTVASFGPCKGKLLAECACKELQKLGFSKIKDMVRIATASLQKDPMDQCIEEQKEKGHNIKEANHICGCLKKKFASEMADNIYAHAFGKDVIEGKEDRLSAQDLKTLYVLAKEEENTIMNAQAVAAEAELDADIGSALPALPVKAKVEAKVIQTIKLEREVEAKSKVVVKEAKGFFCDECKKPKKSCVCKGDDPDKDKKDDKDDKKVEASTSDHLMDRKKILKVNEEVFDMGNVKTASTPKKVEDIEGNVEAGVPRNQAYMGSESTADSMINKTPKSPVVPRGNAYMGKEREADSMINKELKLPDVATGDAYMGKEKEAQSGMPANSNEIKGTVIADSVELTIKEGKISKIAKQFKEIDTVEKDVEAGVPRSDAKMGEESKAEGHINAPNKGPDVPRSNAYMGKEKEADSLINADLKGPDVPTDNAYMGKEKEVQKDMPGINDEMLKQVRMQREDQLNKIAAAREKQAMKVASWLVGNNRIPNDMESFDAAVKALSAFEIDKITTVANMLFPNRTIKTASTQAPKDTSGIESHGIPAIVMESKATQDSSDFLKKLSSAFTIGSRDFDKNLTMFGERD